MQVGAITSYIDWAQVALYAFWAFFAGLIFYLRREDKREGYPLVSDRSHAVRVQGFPLMPSPKTFLMKDGSTRYAPRIEPEQPTFDSLPVAPWIGAPLQPLGNPMVAGAGPAAYAMRADVPDMMQETNEPRVVPLRSATDHYLDAEGVDPRGMEVRGADGVVAGIVSDVWVDRAETFPRYLEVTLAAGVSVLVPTPLAKMDVRLRRVMVNSVLGSQFSDAPQLAHPDVVTLREEDRVSAYFASGNLYATPARAEPLL